METEWIDGVDHDDKVKNLKAAIRATDAVLGAHEGKLRWIYTQEDGTQVMLRPTPDEKENA